MVFDKKLWNRNYSRERRKTPKYKKYMQKYQKSWREKNPKKHYSYIVNWKKNNPEKVSQINFTYIKRAGLTLKSLWVWAQEIKRKVNNKCEVCNKPAKHSHHIFPKAKFPQLALNENNGVALCILHHKEAHGWFN